MNSRSEGFGLVLLEAMLNRTPWAARDIAGAHDLKAYGTVYSTYEDLVRLLRTFAPDPAAIDRARDRVLTTHLVEHAFDDIESVLLDLRRARPRPAPPPPASLSSRLRRRWQWRRSRV